MKPDRPIEPISEFFFHAPNEIVNQTIELVSRGLTGQEILPPKPHALVLTAEADHNGAFDLSFSPLRPLVTQINARTMKKLESLYHVTNKRVDSSTGFCRAIREEAEKRGPIRLLWSNAHGSPQCIQLGNNNSDEDLLCRGQNLMTRCFDGLAPDATVVLDSCSGGEGGADGRNLANALAGVTHPNVRIFASREPHEMSIIADGDPLAVSFWTPDRENSTYLVDRGALGPGVSDNSTVDEDQLVRSDPLDGLDDFFGGSRAVEGSRTSHDITLLRIVSTVGQLTSQMVGVSAAVNTVSNLRLVLKQPLQAPRVLAERWLATVEGHVRHLQGFRFANLASPMALINVSSSALALLDVVSTIVELFRTPKDTLRALASLPYMTVKCALTNIRDLFTHPKRALPRMLKSIVMAPVQTVRRFLSAVGLRRRRRKRRGAECQSMVVTIDPAEEARRQDVYIRDLATLYELARAKWFVVPTRTPEQYHHDVLRDATNWNMAEWHRFPGLLVENLQRDLFGVVHCLSPTAHPPFTVAPPNVILATREMVVKTVEAIASVNALSSANETHQQLTTANIGQMEVLENSVSRLSSLVRANQSRLRQLISHH